MVQERKEKETEPQVKRIIYEYDNGTLSYIEGEDAKSWNKDMENVSVHLHFHPAAPKWSRLNWKELNVTEAERLFNGAEPEKGSTT
ncbi:MAG TPA: hypothetical protein VIK81_04225 [Patescibacteria group bacterium]